MTNESYPEKYSRLQSLIGKLGHNIKGPIDGFIRLHDKSLDVHHCQL